MLETRFGNLRAPDVQTARERLGEFLHSFDTRSREAELAPARLKELFAKPETTRMLYAAFENAMETDDQLKIDTLADLVLGSLTAKDGSVDGPAMRIAIERIRDVTTVQTRLLSFIMLLHVDPLADFYTENNLGYDESELDLKRNEYVLWLQTHVRPHMFLTAKYTDFTHLKSLGLVDFSESLEGYDGFTPPPLNGLVMLFPDMWNDVRISDIVGMIQDSADSRSARWGISMVAACSLPPAGKAIASSALREISGLDV